MEEVLPIGHKDWMWLFITSQQSHLYNFPHIPALKIWKHNIVLRQDIPGAAWEAFSMIMTMFSSERSQ